MKYHGIIVTGCLTISQYSLDDIFCLFRSERDLSIVISMWKSSGKQIQEIFKIKSAENCEALKYGKKMERLNYSTYIFLVFSDHVSMLFGSSQTRQLRTWNQFVLFGWSSAFKPDYTTWLYDYTTLCSRRKRNASFH